MTNNEDYKNIITDLVKKQIIMVGPNVALSVARKVAEVKIEDDGTVTEINGDPQAAMENVTNQYMNLSGQIARVTLKTILEKYPNIKQAQKP